MGIVDLERRPHQRDIEEVADRVIAGTWGSKKCVSDVVPGGGKTALAYLLANKLLDAGVVQSVIHVVPRATLRKQVAEAYVESGAGYVLHPLSDNSAPLYVRETLPEGRVVGVVCSYDQLISNPDLFIDHCKSARTLLTLDEAGMLAVDDAKRWGPVSLRLHEFAAFTNIMSGTLFRHDGLPIPLVEYGAPDAKGWRHPKADITYGLAQAIADGAVKELEFVRLDGATRYQFGEDELETILSSADREEEGRSLRTFLEKEETWQPLIDLGLEHWVGWRREVYPSRMIIIARNVEHAERVCAYVRSKHGVDCAQATSDVKDAHAVLDEFRGTKDRHGSPDVLVTVAMASIGFDVPDTTHLVYLSGYRSLAWMLQALLRIGRVDKKCNLPAKFQTGFVFCPDDRRMAACVEHLRNAVSRGVRERDERESASKPNVDEKLFVPISSAPGVVSVSGLKGDLPDDEAQGAMRLIRECPEAAGIPPTKLAAILRFQKDQNEPLLDMSPRAPSVHPTARRKMKQQQLEQMTRLIDYRSKSAPGSANAQLKGMYSGRPPGERTEKELDHCLSWCTETLRYLPVR